jgi:hypothetical protein
MLGYGSSGFGVASIAHVAVHPRNGIVGKFAKGMLKCRGWLNRRISNGEVKNIFCPELGAQTVALLKHFSDPG